MNDLRHLIADLEMLAVSYSNRRVANGDDHPDNHYLEQQSRHFTEAAREIREAVALAKYQTHLRVTRRIAA